MKNYLIVFSLILFTMLYQEADAQKVLLLQKPGKEKRFLYHTGDKIIVHTGNPVFKVSGEITYIDDSVFTIDKNFTYRMADIIEVDRIRHWFAASWTKLIAASVLYAGGSMINRGIHDEKPLIDNTIPIVSGSFIALGATSYFLRYRKCSMEDEWRLKVLDYDIFKKKTEDEE